MNLKVGDLVRVCYPNDEFFAGEKFVGFITETRESGVFDRMWCLSTGTEHILNHIRDEIEVLSR
jgi:hypothetical protein|tara:strand:- start:876 stop:1067 length:192 start_codon:yes stop_codon:yes gene_type:complete